MQKQTCHSRSPLLSCCACRYEWRQFLFFSGLTPVDSCRLLLTYDQNTLRFSFRSLLTISSMYMRGSVCLVDTTLSGPSSSRHHHRPASETLAGRWWPITECWLGSFVVLQGIQTSIAKRPYIFCDFSGGGGGVRTPYPPSGSAHGVLLVVWSHVLLCLHL